SPTWSAAWTRSGGFFDYDAKRERLEEVERELEHPDVWNDPARAQALGRERSILDKTVNGIRRLSEGLAGAAELLELAEAEGDEETAQAVAEDVDGYQKGVEQLEFQRMFSGEMDSANAFVDIQAGAGGTEAQDWAEMLLRMYLRWCESRGWKTELLEASGGDVAGIKSATFRVEGEYAYGWLKTETGVHRLVRKSPFDSDNRRHTSFTSVFVSPEVDDDIAIDINPADLRTDAYRPSGARAQHGNKTEQEGRIAPIEGKSADGRRKPATGVPRLVRKSPFDSDNRRHTSFTSVFVSPEVDDDIAIDINPADLRTDVYRSSGAGGQHVNKTESAVRITHVPTGIVVACQTERSQHANRDRAMKMLAAKLYEFELQKRNAEKDAVEASKSDIGWGSQIRNYVLDQSRIKDLRTGIERSDTQKVLDGDLDEFVEASLKAGLEAGAKRSDAV